MDRNGRRSYGMKTGIIILLVGKSGSGKSTICDALAKKYGYKVLKSYTTRPLRLNDPKDATTHTFVSKDEFVALEQKCAYTKFDEYEYCATSQQVDESDIYIIDPKGVKYFRNHYNGKKQPIVIYLDGEDNRLREQMGERGDDIEKVEQRILNDRLEFNDFYDFNYFVPITTVAIECQMIDIAKHKEERALIERMLP